MQGWHSVGGLGKTGFDAVCGLLLKEEITRAFYMIPRDQTSADEKDRTRRLQRTASGLLYAVLVAVAIWMIRDFIPAVVWAAVIAIALWPLLTWLEQRPVFKERRTWLAVLLTVVLTLVFVVAFILVASQAANEARDVLRWFC